MDDKENQEGQEDFEESGGDDFGLPEFSAEEDFGSQSDDFGSTENSSLGNTTDDFKDSGLGSDDFGSTESSSGDENYVGSIFGSDMPEGEGSSAGDTGDPEDPYSYEEDEEESSGSSKGFIYVIIVICILLAGGGVGYLMLTKDKDKGAAALADAIIADSTALDSANLVKDASLTENEALKDEVAAVESEKTDATEELSVATSTTPTSTSPRSDNTYKTPSNQDFGNTRPSRDRGLSGVETLKSPTGKAYIIIASFSNKSRAHRYAKQVSGKGHNIMIIPPFRSAPYYRVAVADFTSPKEAFRNRNRFKGEFGHDIWVLAYR